MLIFFDRTTFEPLMAVQEDEDVPSFRWLTQDATRRKGLQRWMYRLEKTELSTIVHVSDGQRTQFATERYPALHMRVRPELLQRMQDSGLLLMDVRAQAQPYWQQMQRMRMPYDEQYRLLMAVNYLPERLLHEWESAWREVVSTYAH